MKRQEMLLSILGEEGCEVSQQTSKAHRFGLYNIRNGSTNAEKLQVEFNDLLAVAEMLNEEDNEINLYPRRDLIEAKRNKVEKYLIVSKELGTLTE